MRCADHIENTASSVVARAYLTRRCLAIEVLLLRSRVLRECVYQAVAYYVYIFLMGWDWVHLVLRPLFGLLYQPQMIDDDDCRAVDGVRISRGDRSTRRKPAPVPLCPPQIPHDLIRARTLAAAVRSRRLTAWAMARPGPLPGNGFTRYNIFIVSILYPRTTMLLYSRSWSFRFCRGGNRAPTESVNYLII
jgi:hypothetical protein